MSENWVSNIGYIALGATIGAVCSPFWMFLGTYGGSVTKYDTMTMILCGIGGALFGFNRTLPNFDMDESKFRASADHREKMYQFHNRSLENRRQCQRIANNGHTFY